MSPDARIIRPPEHKGGWKMRTKQVDIFKRYSPIPIAVLIRAANCFDCDIYIANGTSMVNVKNYDEMKKDLVTQDRNLLFYFNGKDEKDAERRIIMLFQQ